MPHRPKAPGLYPMPVHRVLHHPGFVILPAAGRGMLFSLLTTYWRGGCRWFPPSDLGQSQWAQAHLRTWKLHKTGILEIFAAARPELDAYHRKRDGNRAGLIAAAHSANSTRRLKALQENTARAQAVRLDLPSAGLVPRREANPIPRPIPPDRRAARPKWPPIA